MPPRVLLAQNKQFDPAEIELALHSLGWEVVSVTSAAETTALALDEDYQLILLSMSFEDGDGIAVAKAIRESEGAARKSLIVATGHGGASEQETCVQAGMDGVVNLDCDKDELVAQLQKWIARLAFRMWKTEGMPRLTLDRMWSAGQ